jgi:hypothetical protein
MLWKKCVEKQLGRGCCVHLADSIAHNTPSSADIIIMMMLRMIIIMISSSSAGRRRAGRMCVFIYYYGHPKAKDAFLGKPNPGSLFTYRGPQT